MGESKNEGVTFDTTQFSCAVYYYDVERVTEGKKPSEVKQNNSDEASGLELVTSPLPAEQECQLRLFLIRRLQKGAIYTGTGNFSGMDFSLTENRAPAVSFYILVPCQKVKHVLICLLATTDTNLEVFRPELTQFCNKLASQILPEKGKELPITVLARLTTWYSICLQYIGRVMQALGPNISSLLQLAQQNRRLAGGVGVNQVLVDDVDRFLDACIVAECLAEVGHAAELHKVGDTYIVDGVDSNAYCTDWAHMLLDLGPDAEPWRLRRVLEAFKLKITLLGSSYPYHKIAPRTTKPLQISDPASRTIADDGDKPSAKHAKTIKDMNTLKRFLKQAETDHYSLYRAYSFLWQSGNGDVLLKQAKLEGTSSQDVISALQEHLEYVATQAT